MNLATSILIARKELRSYFFSPVAYIVIVIFLIVTGWFFFSPFFLLGRADLRGFFSLLPIILVFFVPAITMRTYSEEFGTGSYEILYTLPVTTLDILVGKYVASLIFILLMIVPTFSYPLWISSVGDLDWGPVFGGYIGVILLTGGYCAVGLFTSSLTKNQIVAFISATTICFFLYFIDKVLFLVPSFMAGFLQFLSADFHFRNVSKGVIDSRDVVYFFSLIAVALLGTRAAAADRQ